MNPTPRIRMAVVAGAAAVALLGAGAGAAVAAPAASSAPSAAQAEKPVSKTNTVTADKTAVQPWEEFRLTGEVSGIASGATVHIQQKQNGKWVTLPGTSVVNNSGGYSIRVKLGMEGDQQVRTLIDGTPSNAVTVTVG